MAIILGGRWGIHGWVDDADGADSPGSMRQPGQPVCRARRGPVAGSRLAARTRLEPKTHSGRTVHRSDHDFAGRRRGGTVGQLGTVARNQCMAAISQSSHPSGGEPRCKSVCGRSAAGAGQRSPLWRCARQAGAANESIRSDQGRIGRPDLEADECTRCAAGRSDCDLRGAGDVVASGSQGAVRSLHVHFGFDIQNTMLASTDLSMSGYSGDRVPAMQKRMTEALEALPGVESVGLTDALPLAVSGEGDSVVFTDNTSDLRPSNAATGAAIFNVTPEYFQAAGTALLSGRTFTWHDDKNSPRVAVVNREFARKLFGFAANPIGRAYKMRDGSRIQVVGIAEDGKYNSLTEDPVPVMFFPILQSPGTSTILVVRSRPGLANASTLLGHAMRRTLRQLDSGMPLDIETRDKPMDITLFGPRMATVSLGVLGMMGALLSITGIFGMAAYSVSKRLRELGIRVALGAQRKEVLQAALGRALRLLAIGSVAGLLLGILASRVLAFVVYQATPRDPLVLAGVVVAMALLGLVATWIPARRALTVSPLVLLRED
jgi:hypothetical protein